MSFSKSEIALAEVARAISAFWKTHSCKVITNWAQNRKITYTYKSFKQQLVSNNQNNRLTKSKECQWSMGIEIQHVKKSLSGKWVTNSGNCMSGKCSESVQF